MASGADSATEEVVDVNDGERDFVRTKKYYGWKFTSLRAANIPRDGHEWREKSSESVGGSVSPLLLS